jgi:hypothetical protein
MRLSEAQIENFGRDGYVFADGFLGNEEITHPQHSVFHMLKILPEGAAPILRGGA